MLTHDQIEKYADILIWGLKTVRPSFKKYDVILIRCDIEGLKLGQVLHRKLVQQKYNVVFKLISTPVIERDFYQFSDSSQRKFIAKGDREFYENLNGNIYIHAPSSLTHLRDIDPKRISEVARTRKILRDIMFKNEEKGKFGWTLCTYPTGELASQARISLKEYSNQIIKACFLDEASPVKKWSEIYKDITEIKNWLKSLDIDILHIESKNIDLKIKIGEKRRFLGISGHNIPSFEIFTSPDSRSTSGFYYSNLPSFRDGNYVEGVRLEFKDGNAVKILAQKGNDFVRKILSTDAGAKRVGEISFTDRRFSRIDRFMADTLFDENFGGKFGNCHIAVGDSYSDTYSGNISKLTPKIKEKLGFNNSAIHWDLVNTEDKKVTAILKTGKSLTIYESGQFKY